jgi:hypothetical protein
VITLTSLSQRTAKIAKTKSKIIRVLIVEGLFQMNTCANKTKNLLVNSTPQKEEQFKQTIKTLSKHFKNPAAVALGKMKSDKKAASSRKNGCLGGRPKAKQ